MKTLLIGCDLATTFTNYILNIILKFIEQLNNNEKLTIETDGSVLISFLNIDDFCNGINVVMDKGKIGEIYHLCNYEKYSILDVAKILIKHLKHTDEYLNWVNFCEKSDFYKSGHNYFDDNQKLKDLGWEIKTNFEVTLFNLMKPFYKNIPDNFDPYIYKNLNLDLKHIDINFFDSIYHYETQGYQEYRVISLDLNYKIFVYCCRKSGSSTLSETFIRNGFNTLHLHGHEDYSRLFPSTIEPDLFKLINNCIKYHDEIYFIDVYRTPIERKISSFFQNITNENLNMEPEKIEKLIDNVIYEIENYTSINEVLEHFNLPYFEHFDFEKKYNLLKYRNINIIKLRFQDINNWESILTDIFKRPIHLVSKNLGEQKKYGDLYKKIKKSYRIHKYMLDYIRNDKESLIYLTQTELNDYINSWETKTKEYKNIPNDFNPQTYIDLNQDLQENNYDVIRATHHYENYGFMENRHYLS